MCEFTEFVQHNREAMRGRSVSEMFPHQARVIPYESVKPGHCITSGVPLRHEEMHPPGRCTRSLSQEHYGYVVNNRRSNCSICGSQLSAEKIQGQQYSPREIENHFCESCIPYWSILHSKVVGEDMSFLAEEQGHVVDRPVLGQGQAQIPYQPVRPALTNDRPKTVDELLERGGTHKGKPVKVLRLNKNDQGTWE